MCPQQEAADPSWLPRAGLDACDGPPRTPSPAHLLCKASVLPGLHVPRAMKKKLPASFMKAQLFPSHCFIHRSPGCHMASFLPS